MLWDSKDAETLQHGNPSAWTKGVPYVFDIMLGVPPSFDNGNASTSTSRLFQQKAKRSDKAEEHETI